jgi:hypothetical protein
VRLDDGTVVRFDGATLFVNLQVSHDPGQVWVLVFALTMMAGLLVSLIVRRRRVWARIEASSPPGTVNVEWAGWPGPTTPGWGSEFEKLTERLLTICPPRRRRKRRSNRMNTEHIDIGLARYSDWAFTSSIIVLVAALLLAVELASSRGRKVEARELVAWGGVSADSDRPGVVIDEPGRSLDERAGAPAWPWSTSASRCCSPASCCAAWPPRGCPGATCTSSST